MNRFSTNRQRLLVFHTECVYLRGGEKYIYELIKRVSRRHTIILFVESITPYWKTKYRRCHISVRLLWKPKRMYWFLLPLTLIINYISLNKTVLPTDTVFATSFPLSFLATILSKNSVVFCFEPLSVFYDLFRIKMSSLKERLSLSIIKFIYSPLDHLAIRRAHLVATLNTPVALAIENRYHRSPDLYIPNGVDTHFFSPSARPLFYTKKRDGFIIGHSTDYTTLKGTVLLLNALPSVVKRHGSVLLLISESLPNTTMRRRYKNLISSLGIQNNVRFVGCLPENKLPRFYASCDVFCYCGSTRCVGGSSASLSVIEAESCGVPILRTKGNTDEIIQGKTGIYFTSESTHSVANTILLYMALSKNTTSHMGVEARKHVVTTFSWDYSAKKIETLI